VVKAAGLDFSVDFERFSRECRMLWLGIATLHDWCHFFIQSAVIENRFCLEPCKLLASFVAFVYRHVFPITSTHNLKKRRLNVFHLIWRCILIIGWPKQKKNIYISLKNHLGRKISHLHLKTIGFNGAVFICVSKSNCFALSFSTLHNWLKKFAPFFLSNQK